MQTPQDFIRTVAQKTDLDGGTTKSLDTMCSGTEQENGRGRLGHE